jgi:hypothetical protein
MTDTQILQAHQGPNGRIKAPTYLPTYLPTHLRDESEDDAVLALVLVEQALVLEVLHPLPNHHLEGGGEGCVCVCVCVCVCTFVNTSVYKFVYYTVRVCLCVYLCVYLLRACACCPGLYAGSHARLMYVFIDVHLY